MLPLGCDDGLQLLLSLLVRGVSIGGVCDLLCLVDRGLLDVRAVHDRDRRGREETVLAVRAWWVGGAGVSVCAAGAWEQKARALSIMLLDANLPEDQ